jgi:hypothetical protein
MGSGSDLDEWVEELYKAGKISWAKRDRWMRAAQSAKTAVAKEELRAKMREIDRYLGSGKGSLNVQGGLPSLGKRRP